MSSIISYLFTFLLYIQTIEEDIHNIDNYRKTKPIADKLETVVFKERYRKEHEADLIIFSAAEKYLKKDLTAVNLL